MVLADTQNVQTKFPTSQFVLGGSRNLIAGPRPKCLRMLFRSAERIQRPPSVRKGFSQARHESLLFGFKLALSSSLMFSMFDVHSTSTADKHIR
jgi:hypothetical protein